MRLNRIFAQSIVLALVTSTTASAQVTLRNTARELTDGLSDVLHIWVSPFRAEGRDWISALGVAAGAAALLPVDDQVDSSRKVALVNETFVRRYLAPANPIGATMKTVVEPGGSANDSITPGGPVRTNHS